MGTDGQPRGVTVNSFTTVSLDPPLVLVCVGRSSRSFAAFDGAEAFAINVLASDQRQLSATFASKAEDKFADANWEKGRSGSPVFPDSLASFECVLHEKVDAGDHIVLIGRVIDIHRASGTPLGYFSGNYIDFAMQRETVDTPGHCFGGLFHCGEELLFIDQDGKLALPFATSLGEEQRESDSLLGKLEALGLSARLSFVYSVFTEEGRDGLSAIYLGEIEPTAQPRHPSVRLLKPEDIPFEQLSRFSGLIRRYIRERDTDQFGLYVGTAIKGTIHRAR
ncbi:flavin reductase family protein [Microvirga antarctica]|uniref:flavin reductase family protein n=1 Tax=Microvirga antarctica TaxID=2819233 RepID=UPI001B3020F2|nr:flavin reductase family protein [Microvirga antarctica]